MSNRIEDYADVQTIVTNDVVVTELTIWNPAENASRTFVGTARRFGGDKDTPADKADPQIGYTLALSRALKAAGARLERQANGLVKCAEDNRQASVDRQEQIVKARAKAARDAKARERRLAAEKVASSDPVETVTVTSRK